MTTPSSDAVAAVAAALTDPDAVALSTDRRGSPSSLAGGAVGIALLHIERAHTGHADPQTAHTWLTRAATDPLSHSGDANLFHGAPALAFALHTASTTSTHYRQALARLDPVIEALTRSRLAAAHARIDRGKALQMREFDLIHGLTGLGVLHLRHRPDHPITRDVLTYLTRLTHPLDQTTTAGLPPWWLPSALTGEPDPETFPHGHANIGVAHGISAVIALLSLALLRDVAPPGAREAVTALCAWADQWRHRAAHHRGGENDDDLWWPGYLTAGDGPAPDPVGTARPRPSWCYGVAGTARAQQLAGLALGDAQRVHDAETAVLAVLRDPAQHTRLTEIGLCHGTAGLLQAAWRIADDGDNPDLAAALPALADTLATRLFTQLAQSAAAPELMDGAAGAALALHTLTTDTPPASGWDAVLLLA